MSEIVDEVDSETFEYPLYVPIEAGLEIISDTKKEFPAIGVRVVLILPSLVTKVTSTGNVAFLFQGSSSIPPFQ